MKNAKQSFHQLLEQYVFKVAHQSIEFADQATQEQLMDLVKRLDQEHSPVGAADPALVGQSIPQAETEWQQILNEPVNWQSVHQEWLNDIICQHRKRHEAHIAWLEEAIESTQKRLQQFQWGLLSEPHRSRLLSWYRQTLADYQHQLAIKQTENRLNVRHLQKLHR